jgi:uncharacterized membrane protein YhaH (DUF805 family)
MDDNNINQENIDQNISQNSVQNAEKLQEISDIYQPQPQYKSQSNTDYDEIIVEMSPIGYYFRAFQKYAQFSGRATRAEYWWFIIGNNIILTILNFIGELSNFLNFIFVLAMIIPTLSVTARRLHDVGKSGWLQLLGIIASIVIFISALLSLFLGFAGGAILFSGNSSEIGSGILGIAVILAVLSLISVGVNIWLFILTIQDSTPGSNKYGPNPKGIQA